MPPQGIYFKRGGKEVAENAVQYLVKHAKSLEHFRFRATGTQLNRFNERMLAASGLRENPSLLQGLQTRTEVRRASDGVCLVAGGGRYLSLTFPGTAFGFCEETCQKQRGDADCPTNDYVPDNVVCANSMSNALFCSLGFRISVKMNIRP